MRKMLAEYGQAVLAAITGIGAIALACGCLHLLKPVIESILIYLIN